VAISHETVLYDVHDFKVYTLISDSAAASPTFGPAVDCPGINQVGMDPNMVTAEVHGDARIVARRGRTDRFKVTATFAKLQIDVWSVVMGGTISDISSPAETRWDLYAPAPLPFFKAEFKVDDVDVGLGTAIVRLNKCQLTGGTLFGQSSNNFGQPHMTFEAYQPDNAATTFGTLRLLAVQTALSP